MVKTFNNKTALILGGSSGLGYATALKLAQHGMNIIIVYRASRIMIDGIDNCFNEIKKLDVSFYSYNTDAVREEKIDATIDLIKADLKQFKLYTVIHSIARGNLKSMTQEPLLTSDDYQLTIQSMGTSFYSWCSKLIAHDLILNPARFIAFTSEGSSRPMENYAAVSAAKAVLETIIRNMAIEYASLGITSNCIQAGVTDTDSLRRIPNADKIKEHAIKRQPQNRLTVPQDVANAVYLLCCDESQWINGAIIPVDGGESLV